MKRRLILAVVLVAILAGCGAYDRQSDRLRDAGWTIVGPDDHDQGETWFRCNGTTGVYRDLWGEGALQVVRNDPACAR